MLSILIVNYLKLQGNQIILLRVQRRQHGAFLIFGAKETLFYLPNEREIKPIPEINPNWIVKGKDKNRIIIKSSHKKDIIDELNRLGINKSTLFPEIDKVADYIKDKIQKKQI